MQLFWRKGYAATSVEDLVSALHLSRSSFYATFGDKRSLFLEALKLYSERVISRTARTLSEAPSTLTRIDDAGDVESGSYDGRNLHFGIREHAMGAVVNGLTLLSVSQFYQQLAIGIIVVLAALLMRYQR